MCSRVKAISSAQLAPVVVPAAVPVVVRLVPVVVPTAVPLAVPAAVPAQPRVREPRRRLTTSPEAEALAQPSTPFTLKAMRRNLPDDSRRPCPVMPVPSRPTAKSRASKSWKPFQLKLLLEPQPTPQTAHMDEVCTSGFLNDVMGELETPANRSEPIGARTCGESILWLASV